jgi:hypothetical protein
MNSNKEIKMKARVKKGLVRGAYKGSEFWVSDVMEKMSSDQSVIDVVEDEDRAIHSHGWYWKAEMLEFIDKEPEGVILKLKVCSRKYPATCEDRMWSDIGITVCTGKIDCQYKKYGTFRISDTE